jgi:glucose-1-phosphate thymidylyltransferase
MENKLKGIILAGGSGTRLYPMTKIITKQLQPVYDKPMIYYPLSLLMLGGMKDILLITTPHDLPHFQNLLGDGSQFGIKLTYKIQEKPNGLPEAFILGDEFIGDDDVCLILGDNLFYGDIQFFREALIDHKLKKNVIKGRIFAYSIATRAKNLKPSPRGETEIVDLILDYHKVGQLGVEVITRGVAWLDTGTPRSLLDASAYIGAIEERQGLKVACLEEVAYRMGFITEGELCSVVAALPNSSYKNYLEKFMKDSF